MTTELEILFTSCLEKLYSAYCGQPKLNANRMKYVITWQRRYMFPEFKTGHANGAISLGLQFLKAMNIRQNILGLA